MSISIPKPSFPVDPRVETSLRAALLQVDPMVDLSEVVITSKSLDGETLLVEGVNSAVLEQAMQIVNRAPIVKKKRRRF